GEVVLLPRQAEVGERDGIEIVVGQGYESETDAAEDNDFVDDGLILPLARFLSVGTPDAAERTVLGTSANGLDGGPHVFLGVDKVPARGQELASFDPSAFVDGAE